MKFQATVRDIFSVQEERVDCCQKSMVSSGGGDWRSPLQVTTTPWQNWIFQHFLRFWNPDFAAIAIWDFDFYAEPNITCLQYENNTHIHIHIFIYIYTHDLNIWLCAWSLTTRILCLSQGCSVVSVASQVLFAKDHYWVKWHHNHAMVIKHCMIHHWKFGRLWPFFGSMFSRTVAFCVNWLTLYSWMWFHMTSSPSSPMCRQH